MARLSALLLPATLALAMGALSAPEAAAQEAHGPAAPSDTARASGGLFDARTAAGHKPRRRGVRRAPATPPAAARAVGVYEPAPLTPGGGIPVVAVPAPRPPQTEPPPASGAAVSGAAASGAAVSGAAASGAAAPLYDSVPERPAFFDTRIARGHMDPAERDAPLLFDSQVAEGHKELPVPDAFAGLFIVPPEAITHVDTQRRVIRLRFRGTARLQRRYFPAIERALVTQGLPEHLKYVALIESGLNPQAVSHAGARGLWQIMPETAGDFGLDSMAVHEPAAATRAAVLYLDRLHRMFDGDWLLAIAAYNAGPGRVLTAVRAFQRNMGRRPSYWEIRHRLPRETREYVPRFLAAVEHFEA